MNKQCNLELCKATLFQKGNEYSRECRVRHPEWHEDRDIALKTASKRNRRHNTYPAKASQLLQQYMNRQLTLDQLERQDLCIREQINRIARRKLVSEEAH
jgi:hypothetical protein